MQRVDTGTAMTRRKPPISIRSQPGKHRLRRPGIAFLLVWLSLGILIPTGGKCQDTAANAPANSSLDGAELDRLLRDLENPDRPNIRERAARALGELGDARAVEPLLKAVKYSVDHYFQEAVCRALGQLKDPRAVDFLIGMLRDPDLQVRLAAVEALGQIKDLRASAPLLRCLDKPDGSEREAAVLALGKIGDPRAMDSLLELLRGNDTRLSDAASFALAGMMGESVVSPLLLLLKDPDTEIRHRGVSVFTRLKDESALTPLILALEDPGSWEYRQGAALSLMNWGGSRAVEPLIKALKDPQPEVRDSAALTLGSLGDSRAIPPLVEALQDLNQVVRIRAAFSLAILGDTRGPAALLETVRGDDLTARKEAAATLGNLRELGMPSLLQAMQDTNPEVRIAAIEGLGQYGNEQAVAPLMEALKQGDSAARTAATAALVRIGQPGVLSMLKSLKDADHVFRGAVIDIVVAMKEPAVYSLMEALRDPDWFVRAGAATALGGLRSPVAVIPLLKALEDKDWQVRQSAVTSLGQLEDIRAVEPLIGVLPDLTIRFEVIEALGRLGDVRAVGPLLEELQASPLIRKATVEALGELGDAGAVDPLIQLLIADSAGSDNSERAGVASALARLGDARAVEPLIRTMKDSDTDLRRIMAEAVGQLGEPAIKPLIEALKDADPASREGAVIALIKLGDPVLKPVIGVLMDSSDEGIRKDSAATLAGLGDSAVDPLIHALDDPDRNVRQRAVMALSGFTRTPHFLKSVAGPAASWNPISRFSLGRLFVSDGQPFTRIFFSLCAGVIFSSASLVYSSAILLLAGIPLGRWLWKTTDENRWWMPGWAGWICAGSLLMSTLLYGWMVFAGAGGWVVMLVSLGPLWLALTGAALQGMIRWPLAWRRAGRYLCQADLSRFEPKPGTWLFRWSGGALVFESGWNGDLAESCACRVCGRQERKFVGVSRVVAVLDSKSGKLFEQTDSDMRINWLIHRKPFDLEAVELVIASDEEVEAFTNQMRFESDDQIATRLLSLRCSVNSICVFKEGTMRLLKLTFGRVVRE